MNEDDRNLIRELLSKYIKFGVIFFVVFFLVAIGLLFFMFHSLGAFSS